VQRKKQEMKERGEMNRKRRVIIIMLEKNKRSENNKRKELGLEYQNS
jgi:hypothetical protein